MSDFCDRIDETVKLRNITKKQLFKDLSLSIQSFYDWKYNHILPNAETVIKLSEYLDVSCDYLLTGKENGLQPKEPRFTKKQIMDALETALGDFKKSVDKKL